MGSIGVFERAVPVVMQIDLGRVAIRRCNRLKIYG